ncbi:MAG: transposase [Eubacteriales bacterium]
MTTSDIGTHISEIYGVKVSHSTIGRVTDKIPWPGRGWMCPFDEIYAVLFMDAVHIHVRCEGDII